MHDTVGGFNTFLADQQDEDGTASVSLYDFNTNVDLVLQRQHGLLYVDTDAPDARK